MHLSRPQQLIYDMENFVGNSISIVCGSMITDGKKTENEITSILNNLYRKNDFLRIKISEDESFKQTVMPYREQKIEVFLLFFIFYCI